MLLVGLAALGLAGSLRSEELRSDLVLAFVNGASPTWQGISPDEPAGAQGPAMLYPAPSAVGLLAAVLTHAALVQGSRSAERTARQAEADRILQPHAQTIAALTGDVLLAETRKRLASETLAVARGMTIEMEPRFALSADRRTLVLDNILRGRADGADATPRFQAVVRVVSTPCDAADPLVHWSAEEGSALKRESAAMLAHSIEVALAPQAAADPAAFRTQRYRFGSAERMERGQPVLRGCNRVVLRTLRDSLMSVPVLPGKDAPPCDTSYVVNSG